MNIIQISATYPPHLGGMENVVKEISERLSLKGYSIEVFTSTIGVNLQEKPKSSLKVNYLYGIELFHTPIIPSLFFKLLRTPKNSIFHIHISQAVTPEIAYLVARLKKTPYIVHFHLDVRESGRLGFLLKYYKKYLLARVLRQANYLICLNENDKRNVITQYGILENKVIVLPNGINTQNNYSRRIKKEMPYRLLFVGRVSKQKNIDLLLEASKLVKTSISLDIVGDGELLSSLKKKAHSNEMRRVFFHGTKTASELVEFYKKADLFILSSYQESFPLVIGEAMSFRLPILAPNLLNLKEAYGDTIAYVNEYTADAFALCIDNLLNSWHIRKKVAELGYKFSKKHTWGEQIAILEKLYGEF